MFSKTVLDENVDISTQIHDFTSKNENLNIKCNNLNESQSFRTSGKQVIIPIELNIDLPDEVNQCSIHGMNHVSLIFSTRTPNFLMSGQV